VRRPRGGGNFCMNSWSPNRSKHKLVLGEDVGLEETVNMELCSLVGRLSYRSMCRTSIMTWVQSTWFPLLGYAPEVIYMMGGWFGFCFKRTEDTLIVLDKF
jgi:hypothetical protein